MVKVPAPWHLSGKGYILLFKFTRDFVQENSFLAEDWMTWYQGGFGSVMLVDYQQSEAGPYKELLFIPGRFSFWGHEHYTISKIYVSTDSSVKNGRDNWAIPKELADFDWQSSATGERVVVTLQDEQIIDIRLRPGGPKFPVNTRFLGLSLGQEADDRVLVTRPYGSGWGQIARINNVSVNKDHFPDISGIKPLTVFRVDPFQMVFPPAQDL